MKQYDKDGQLYPDEKELKFIKEYNVSKKPVKPLIDFIENIWWAKDWGFSLTDYKDRFMTFDFVKSIKFNKKYKSFSRFKLLRLSTGGWSGNEDIMRALHKNEHFFYFYWQESSVGGHYVFKIRDSDYHGRTKK